MLGISNKGGTGGGSGANGGADVLMNLPITISTTQPTAKRSGHLWIKSNIGSKINKVVVCPAVLANATNGTLMIVANSALRKETLSQKINIEGGASGILLTNEYITMTTPNTWLLNTIKTSNSELVTYLSAYPLFYTLIDGVLDVQTAYVWDGSQWLQRSQQGYYINYCGRIYNNMRNNEYVLNYNSVNIIGLSIDGTWAYGSNSLLKRTGDVYNQVISSHLNSYEDYYLNTYSNPLNDGSMYCVATSRSQYEFRYQLVKLEISGNTYAIKNKARSSYLYSNSSDYSASVGNLCANDQYSIFTTSNRFKSYAPSCYVEVYRNGPTSIEYINNILVNSSSNEDTYSNYKAVLVGDEITVITVGQWSGSTAPTISLRRYKIVGNTITTVFDRRVNPTSPNIYREWSNYFLSDDGNYSFISPYNDSSSAGIFQIHDVVLNKTSLVSLGGLKDYVTNITLDTEGRLYVVTNSGDNHYYYLCKLTKDASGNITITYVKQLERPVNTNSKVLYSPRIA